MGGERGKRGVRAWKKGVWGPVARNYPHPTHPTHPIHSPLAHQVVSLEDLLDVVPVNADGNTHDHVLRPLGNLAVDAEEVTPLEGLVSKVVVREIARVVDGGIKGLLVGQNVAVSILTEERSSDAGCRVDMGAQDLGNVAWKVGG